jgi:hypothetical protein
MNCHETYLWMLEAEEPTATPPVTITEHLRDCAKCRRRQKRVFRLLTAVQQLPPPPENPQIRAEVMSIVRQTTVLPSTRPVERRPDGCSPPSAHDPDHFRHRPTIYDGSGTTTKTCARAS